LSNLLFATAHQVNNLAQDAADFAGVISLDGLSHTWRVLLCSVLSHNTIRHERWQTTWHAARLAWSASMRDSAQLLIATP